RIDPGAGHGPSRPSRGPGRGREAGRHRGIARRTELDGRAPPRRCALADGVLPAPRPPRVTRPGAEAEGTPGRRRPRARPPSRSPDRLRGRPGPFSRLPRGVRRTESPRALARRAVPLGVSGGRATHLTLDI